MVSIEENIESLSRALLGEAKSDAAQAFVDAHLLENISLSDIAGAIGLSPFHFTRAFKLATGTTPYRYVLEARIERAKLLIRHDDAKMAEVARATGFNSQSQFSRTFADITGVSPREYKKQSS